MLIGCQTVVLHPAARHEQRGESVAESSQPEDNTLCEHRKVGHCLSRQGSGNTRQGVVWPRRQMETQGKALLQPRRQWEHKERHCYSREGSGNTRRRQDKCSFLTTQAADTQGKGSGNARQRQRLYRGRAQPVPAIGFIFGQLTPCDGAGKVHRVNRATTHRSIEVSLF